ncbi:MAG: hypothetical protein JWL76_2311 [Thermoleophilia bacterium]|nr:hypothetical protein [Thermoleophilia bacterium]
MEQGSEAPAARSAGNHGRGPRAPHATRFADRDVAAARWRELRCQRPGTRRLRGTPPRDQSRKLLNNAPSVSPVSPVSPISSHTTPRHSHGQHDELVPRHLACTTPARELRPLAPGRGRTSSRGVASGLRSCQAGAGGVSMPSSSRRSRSDPERVATTSCAWMLSWFTCVASSRAAAGSAPPTCG